MNIYKGRPVIIAHMAVKQAHATHFSRELLTTYASKEKNRDVSNSGAEARKNNQHCALEDPVQTPVCSTLEEMHGDRHGTRR